MTMFFQNVPRIVVQGITGREARMAVRHTIAYGTEICAGVTPGKGGEHVEGVPVFDTIEAAIRETGGPFDASVVYVPPFMALDAVSEAAANGIRLVLVVTENIPVHDAARLLGLAQAQDVCLIGPNSVGVIEPGRRIRLGAIGGEFPDRAFAQGCVGVMSRSGGLTVELGLQLRLAGLGVSTAISIGGDAMLGNGPAALIRHFQEDDDTEAVVYVGEAGTRMESDLATTLVELDGHKPVVALILGRFIEGFPKGSVFGHAGAVVNHADDAPSTKLQQLANAGALTAETIEEALEHLSGVLSRDGRL